MRNAGDVHNLQNNNQRMPQLTAQQSETAVQAGSLHSDELAVANLINICKHQHDGYGYQCFVFYTQRWSMRLMNGLFVNRQSQFPRHQSIRINPTTQECSMQRTNRCGIQ